MKKSIAVSLLVLGIQACSSSAPSTSDVEKAIKADYMACSNLSVEQVKITNGLTIDDRTHQVQAQYDLRVIPLPDREVQAAQKAFDELTALQEQRQQLDAQYGSAPNEKMLLEESDNAAAHAEKIQQLSNDIQIYNDKLNELVQKRHDLLSKYDYNKQGNIYTYNNLQLFDLVAIEWAAGSAWSPESASCLKKSGVDQNNKDAFLEALTKGYVSSYEAKFTMQNTDNGWQSAE